MAHYMSVCTVAKAAAITIGNYSRQESSYLIAEQQMNDICKWVTQAL